VPNVVGSMEFSCVSCTCTCAPNYNLQCLSYVSLLPVMIVLRLIAVCNPSLCGKMLRRIESCKPFQLLVMEDIFQLQLQRHLILVFLVLSLGISQFWVHVYLLRIGSCLCPCS